MHSASKKVLSTDIATRNESLLPLGARQQQVLCLGTTCTKLAMSSESASGRLTTSRAPAALRGEGPTLNGLLQR